MQLNAGGEPLVKSRGMLLRYLAAQMLIQATAIPVLVVAVVCLVPLAWVYAFYQNVSSLGLTQDYGYRPLRNLVTDAARQSHWAWGNNHLLMMVVAVFSLFVWMSVMMMAIYLPILAKMLLGIESVFTVNPVATLMNSTFVFGTILVVFLCVSPLTKTLYVLRCFYGMSRTSGADLLSRLTVLRNERKRNQVGASKRRNSLGKVASFWLFVSFSGNGIAEVGQENAKSDVSEVEIHQQAEPVSAEEFNFAIQDTLQEKHFQWRLSREQMADEDAGGVQGFVRDLIKSTVSAVKEASQMVETMLERLFGGEQKRKDSREFSDWGGLGKVASIFTVVVLVILLVVAVKMIVSRRRQMGAQEVVADVVGVIDLESEAVMATQLPEDEWMRLAREKIEKGEYRLAVRALFLASLAHLGEHGLLSVTRFKSNQDYRGELSLKARSMPKVIEAFGENVGLFEWAWYGLHDIGDDAVEQFTSNYEKITSMTTQAAKEGHV